MSGQDAGVFLTVLKVIVKKRPARLFPLKKKRTRSERLTYKRAIKERGRFGGSASCQLYITDRISRVLDSIVFLLTSTRCMRFKPA